MAGRFDATTLKATLRAYRALFPGEESAVTTTSSFLDAHAEPLARATLAGHVTGSAFAIDPAARTVLLIHHRKLDRWLQPGGHVDEGESPLEAARREVAEETGLCGLTLAPWHARHPGVPFDIDPHGIPANAAKGEPAHVHYDFRYAFVVAGTARLSLDGSEVLGARWLSFEEAASLLALRLATKLPLAVG